MSAQVMVIVWGRPSTVRVAEKGLAGFVDALILRREVILWREAMVRNR